MSGTWVVPVNTAPGSDGDSADYNALKEDARYLKGETDQLRVVQTVLGAPATSISCNLPTDITPQTLDIFFQGKHASATGIVFGLRFNADSGANYMRNFTGVTNGGASAGIENAQTSMSGSYVGNDATNRFSIYRATVIGPASSGAAFPFKQVLWDAFYPGNLTTTCVWSAGGGQWASTAAITSVQIIAASGNFPSGSLLTLRCTGLPT